MKTKILLISIIIVMVLCTFGCSQSTASFEEFQDHVVEKPTATIAPEPTATPTLEPTLTPTPIPTPEPTLTPTPIPTCMVENTVFKSDILKRGDVVTITSKALEDSLTVASVSYITYDENDNLLEEKTSSYDENEVVTEITIPNGTGKLKVEFTVSDSNGIAKTEMYEYDIQKPVVAITIDDGPTDLTKQFLDVVEEYGIHVTFFEVGYKISKYKEDVKRAAELGCQIGTHTYGHANLAELDKKGIAKEIKKGAEAIYDAIGSYPTVCRFPFGAGATDQDVLNAAKYPSIYWTIDTRDWESKDPVQIMEHVKKVEDLNGYIILIHSTHLTTLEAFKEMVPYLINQGYELVTIERMAEINGVTLEEGKNYRKLLK